MKKQPRQTVDSASFRSNVRIVLLDILDNAQEISAQIEEHHPRTKRPIVLPLGNRTQEYIHYNPETKGFQAFYRNEEGSLYEISLFKREG